MSPCRHHAVGNLLSRLAVTGRLCAAHLVFTLHRKLYYTWLKGHSAHYTCQINSWMVERAHSLHKDFSVWLVFYAFRGRWKLPLKCSLLDREPKGANNFATRVRFVALTGLKLHFWSNIYRHINCCISAVFFWCVFSTFYPSYCLFSVYFYIKDLKFFGSSIFEHLTDPTEWSGSEYDFANRLIRWEM